MFDSLSPPALIALLGFLAGVCIPLGGLLAVYTRFSPKWLEAEFRHFVIALGGGILVGAVGLVLVPQGLKSMDHSHWALAWFLAGSALFFLIERAMGRRKVQAPQFMGMLLDYIPEAIALGGMLAAGAKEAPLLALLIGLQNLPEGFNAYRELRQQKWSGQSILLGMCALVVLGPLSGLAGYHLLGGSPEVLGALMLFASGGILYLIFQDIAPQSKLRRHWGPPIGSAVGFSLAMLSHLLISGH